MYLDANCRSLDIERYPTKLVGGAGIAAESVSGRLRFGRSGPEILACDASLVGICRLGCRKASAIESNEPESHELVNPPHAKPQDSDKTFHFYTKKGSVANT